MFDQQPPTLSEREEARILAADAERHLVEWLLTNDDGPDVETMVDQLVNRPSWHARAACRGVGVDAFVVGRWGRYEAARELCAVCDVREECLEVALANPDLHGLWGGTSERQRKAMRRGQVA